MTEIQYDGGAQKVSYAYDAIGRVSSRVAECGADAGKLTSSYEYVDGGYGTNSTTPLEKKITQNGISFEYEYDSRGNIVSEKRGNLTTTYAYDALGQLIRVNDPHENATWVYSYDRGGNILSKAKYAYTTGTVGTALETIPYAYGDANWKDKLTAYNGKSITYDAIGNPLTDGTWTYQWQAGRQLKQMTKSGTTIHFKYDHNGLRVGKVVNGTETKYMLHGKLVTHLTVGSDNLHFFYDAQSRPAKVSYNGVIYTYIHNLQGDVVGLLDNSGALVVEYRYDAWGKASSTTGSLAATLGKRNPFRYRGYVYDEETGLYYLRSRYYNPLVGRFVNADTVFGKVGTLYSHGLFCYCSNVPTSFYDADGHSAIGVMEGLYNNPGTYELFRAISNYAEKAWTAIKVALAAGAACLVSSLAQTRVEPRNAEQLQAALLAASTSSAGARDHSFAMDCYYFAFILVDPETGFGYLMYINEPLSMEEAQTVLSVVAISGAVKAKYGFRKKAFGIYTDTEGAAYLLATATGSSADSEFHLITNPYPGEYYYHYHAFGATHGPHIWFGPVTVKY